MQSGDAPQKMWVSLGRTRSRESDRAKVAKTHRYDCLRDYEVPFTTMSRCLAQISLSHAARFRTPHGRRGTFARCQTHFDSYLNKIPFQVLSGKYSRGGHRISSSWCVSFLAHSPPRNLSSHCSGSQWLRHSVLMSSFYLEVPRVQAKFPRRGTATPPLHPLKGD